MVHELCIRIEDVCLSSLVSFKAMRVHYAGSSGEQQMRSDAEAEAAHAWRKVKAYAQARAGA